MTKAKHFYSYLIIVALLFIGLEAGVRTFLYIKFKIPFFQPEKILLNYYPELKPALKNNSTDAGLKILVLGGSVVYDSTVTAMVNDTPHHSTFCNLSYLLKKNLQIIQPDLEAVVVSLAKPAHNSLDSWYKYKYLKNARFDFVIIYHGINDTRANNSPSNVFDINYRHIAFYNELHVLNRHPEINITVLPYFIDLHIQRALMNEGYRKTIPKDFSEFFNAEHLHELFRFGDTIKTGETFKRNLENILRLAQMKQETVLLSTYAHYMPDNYTLERFLNRELDYAEQVYPAEIYGSPAHVKAGIEQHNEIAKTLHMEYPEIQLIDFDNVIPKDGKHFNDICHLTDVGCEILAWHLSNIIVNSNGKHN